MHERVDVSTESMYRCIGHGLSFNVQIGSDMKWVLRCISNGNKVDELHIRQQVVLYWTFICNSSLIALSSSSSFRRVSWHTFSCWKHRRQQSSFHSFKNVFSNTKCSSSLIYGDIGLQWETLASQNMMQICDTSSQVPQRMINLLWRAITWRIGFVNNLLRVWYCWVCWTNWPGQG